MCFVEAKGKAFDIIPRKVLKWAMMKKRIPYIFVTSAMSLCEGAKIRVRVDSELSDELEVKAGIHQGSMLSSFFSCSSGRCCHRICQRGCAK